MYVCIHIFGGFIPNLNRWDSDFVCNSLQAAPCFPSSGLVIDKTSSRCKSGSSFQRPNMNNKRNHLR